MNVSKFTGSVNERRAKFGTEYIVFNSVSWFAVKTSNISIEQLDVSLVSGSLISHGADE